MTREKRGKCHFRAHVEECGVCIKTLYMYTDSQFDHWKPQRKHDFIRHAENIIFFNAVWP